MILGLLSSAKATCSKLSVSFGCSRFFAKSRNVGEWIRLQTAPSNERPDLSHNGSTIDLRAIRAENEPADTDYAEGYAYSIEVADFSSIRAPRRGPTILDCMIEALSKMPAS